MKQRVAFVLGAFLVGAFIGHVLNILDTPEHAHVEPWDDDLMQQIDASAAHYRRRAMLMDSVNDAMEANDAVTRARRAGL